MMDYYHIGIETKNNGKIYSKYDITDLHFVISAVIDPYNALKPITISGKRIEPEEIERVSIIKMQLKIEEWLDRRYKSLPSNVIVFFHKEDVFKEQTLNIFDDLVCQQKPKNNLSLLNESKNIFIVHGHDESMLNEVALFVKSIGYNPIILKNEANRGMTIIEKIEEYSNVSYAIVLYSPCDRGFDINKPNEVRKRARQNVVFEHGYLLAKLTRQRVCALVKGDIETPGDVGGVVYVPYGEGWKTKVVKELKTLGFDIEDGWL